MQQQRSDKAIIISLILILTVLILPATTLAANEPKLRLSAESLNLRVGEETTIEILVENVASVYGVESHLIFDPAKLEVTQVQHGNFFSADPDNEAFVLQKQADNRAGTIDYALALLNPAPAVQGDGLVLNITIQAKAEGSTAIQFKDGLFGTKTGQEIIPVMENIEINIISAGVNNNGTNNHQTLPKTALTQNTLPPSPVAHQSVQFNSSENSSNVMLGISLMLGAGIVGLIGLVGLVLTAGGWIWIVRTRRHKELQNSRS